MKWSFDNNMPIYSQIIEQMRLFIVSGEIKAGDRLPAVRELASEAGVNPNTMQRALSELERTELIYSNRTSGRFVTENRDVIENARLELAEKSIDSFIKEMQILGYSKKDIVTVIDNYKGDETDG